jgi:hypothetical protein
MKKNISVIILLLIPIFISSCSSPDLSPSSDVYFKFEGSSINGGTTTSIIKLTDPTLIDEARAIIEGMQGPQLHVGGILIPNTADYNQPLNYHLDSVYFFENAMEICDTWVDVDGVEWCNAMGTPCHFCPWTSRLLYEVSCLDNDGDNFYDESSLSCPGTDCNDENAAINPNSREVCGNLIDENCDGIIQKCIGKTNKKIMRL